MSRNARSRFHSLQLPRLHHLCNLHSCITRATTPRSSLPSSAVSLPPTAVTGARVAERRRKHEPTSPQLITRKTSSLRHVTKHPVSCRPPVKRALIWKRAREKDKVVRSVRRTGDPLARIQPQREPTTTILYRADRVNSRNFSVELSLHGKYSRSLWEAAFN